MMIDFVDIFPAALAVLFVLNAHRTKPADQLNGDYLSLGTAKHFRGFFALFILCHHLSHRIASGLLLPSLVSAGFLAVAVFFFLSGYGLQKSYITKSDGYKKGFLLKRLPGIVFPYLVFILIYWAANAMRGTVYSWKDVLTSLVNGDPIVTYSWYILTILVFYLFYWLFMIACRNRSKRIILYGCAWYVLWALFCYKMKYGVWWYNASHLLVVGIAWASYEENILRFIEKRYSILTPILWICFFILFACCNKLESLPYARATEALLYVLDLVTSVVFVCCVLLLSMKVKIGNRILGFFGEISLEIYLIQGLFIYLLPVQNEFVWCAAVAALSTCSAFLLHLVFNAVLKKYKAAIGRRYR